jgi:hypothetical protein
MPSERPSPPLRPAASSLRMASKYLTVASIRAVASATFALLSLLAAGFANAEGGGHPRNDLPLTAEAEPRPVTLFVFKDGKLVRNPEWEIARSDEVGVGTELAAQGRYLP